jgi:hypothetical protein
MPGVPPDGGVRRRLVAVDDASAGDERAAARDDEIALGL